MCLFGFECLKDWNLRGQFWNSFGTRVPEVIEVFANAKGVFLLDTAPTHMYMYTKRVQRYKYPSQSLAISSALPSIRSPLTKTRGFAQKTEVSPDGFPQWTPKKTAATWLFAIHRSCHPPSTEMMRKKKEDTLEAIQKAAEQAPGVSKPEEWRVFLKKFPLRNPIGSLLEWLSWWTIWFLEKLILNITLQPEWFDFLIVFFQDAPLGENLGVLGCKCATVWESGATNSMDTSGCFWLQLMNVAARSFLFYLV